MEIKGKVHCFFEQSGTFKREFIKLGIPAEDYDIQNNFKETDHVLDLFSEIEKGYNNEQSIFDNINIEDLIMAFFPCIYFETMSMMYFDCSTLNNKHKELYERIDDAIERLQVRTKYHRLLYQLVRVCVYRKIPLIIENPAKTPNYIVGTQNFFKPTIVDKNRLLRGDYFKKPTAYWFFNCKQTHGCSIQINKQQKIIMDAKKAPKQGLCSEERSMISHDYARNFICDFIIGKEQIYTERNLFGL